MQQINFLNSNYAELKKEINLNSAWNDPNIAPSIQNRIYKMGQFLGLHGDEKLYYGTLDGIVYGLMGAKDPSTYMWKDVTETYEPTSEEPEGNISVPPTAQQVREGVVIYVNDEDKFYLADYDKKVESTYAGDEGIDIESIFKSINCFENEPIILTNLIGEEEYDNTYDQAAIEADLSENKYNSAMNGSVVKVTWYNNGEQKTDFFVCTNADGFVLGKDSDFKAYVPEIGEYFRNTENITTETYTWVIAQEDPEDPSDIIYRYDFEGRDFDTPELAGAAMEEICDDDPEYTPTEANKYIEFSNYTVAGQADQPTIYYKSYAEGGEVTKFYQYGTYSLSAIFDEHFDGQNEWVPSGYERLSPFSLVRVSNQPVGGELIKSYPESANPGQSFEAWLDEIIRTQDWITEEAEEGDYYAYTGRNEYYVVTAYGTIRPTDTITVKFELSEVLMEKYAENAIVNIDGKEYTIGKINNGVELSFYMNRDHRVSIKWSDDDIIETFTFIAVR